MAAVVLVARVVLAAALLVAAAAKLARREQTAETLRQFGVPAALSAPGAVILPLVEAVVGVLVLPAATARAAGAAALILLAVFTIGVVRVIRSGEQVECNCFGALSSAPVSWTTVSRNGVLGALALLVAGAGPGLSLVHLARSASATEWLTLGVVLLALAVAGLAWFSAQLLRQQGRLLLRLDAMEEGAPLPSASAPQPPPGLPVGTRAPAFELEQLDGEWVTLADLTAGSEPLHMLVFSDPGCGPCEQLVPQLVEWQNELAGKLSLTVITNGEPDRARALFSKAGVERVLRQDNGQTSQAYRAFGTPVAVIVDDNGAVVSQLAQGAPQITTLVGQAAAGRPGVALVVHNGNGNGVAASPPPRPAPVPVGSAMPEFSLSDLAGDKHTLAELAGRSRLLVFWNPGCGFCQRMTDPLKEWIADGHGQEVILVSAGPVEANAAQGFTSTLLLDPAYELSRQVGANGTPTAIIVDAEGRVASGVASGQDAVFALAATLGEPVEPGS